jgi:hypothetical protein
VIAIFDVRLRRKTYGQLFLKSLPPCRFVHEKAMIGAFFSRSSGDPDGGL